MMYLERSSWTISAADAVSGCSSSGFSPPVQPGGGSGLVSQSWDRKRWAANFMARESWLLLVLGMRWAMRLIQ